MANTTITPSVGLLRLTTNSVAASLVAALTFIGAAPTVNQNIFPGVATVEYGAAAPTLALAFPGSAGAVALSSGAPTLSFGAAASPSTGALTFASDISGLVVGTATPPAGALSLTGFIPTVSVPNQTMIPATVELKFLTDNPVINGSFPPATAQMALTGIAPGLAFQLVLTPAATGPLSLSGVPSVMSLGIAPNTGNLLMTTQVSPTVAPNTAQITLTGYAPALSGVHALVPAPAALQISSDVPSQTLSVPAPPSAALVLNGGAPSLRATNIIQVSVGTLTLSASAGSVVQSAVVTPPAGGVLVGTANPPGLPVLALNLLIPSAGLQLTGVVAIPSVGTVLTPASGAFTFIGNAPTGIPGGSIAPSSGAVTLIGTTPALSPGIVPLSASLVLNGASPSLNLQIAPAVVPLSLSGAAPTVNGRLILVPPTGVITFSQNAPVLSAGPATLVGTITYSANAPTLGLALTPLASALSFASDAPGLSITGIPKTQTGALALTGVGPTLVLGIAPPIATLTVIGIQPIVNSLTTLMPNAGSLVFASDPSDVEQFGVLLPGTVSVGYAADPPVLIRTGFASAATANLVIGGNVPLVIQTTAGYITPGTVSIVFNGQPAMIPLYNPDPYHTVQSPGPDRYTVISPG